MCVHLEWRVQRRRRESFWEELKGCTNPGEDGGRVLVIGDMNAKVRGCEMEGVVGKFGVSGMNENGRKLIEPCMEKKLSLGNIFFEKGHPQIYSREWNWMTVNA